VVIYILEYIISYKGLCPKFFMGGVWNGFGYDESNHGKFPEVCVVVPSMYKGDAVVRQRLFSKHRNHGKILERVDGRTYSFLLFGELDKDDIERDKRLGVILGSLAHGETFEGGLDVYIDGEWPGMAIDFAYNTLAKVSRLRRSRINLYTGGDLDRRVKIVNVADELAHWLFTDCGSFSKLKRNRHCKRLLTNLV